MTSGPPELAKEPLQPATELLMPSTSVVEALSATEGGTREGGFAVKNWEQMRCIQSPRGIRRSCGESCSGGCLPCALWRAGFAGARGRGAGSADRRLPRGMADASSSSAKPAGAHPSPLARAPPPHPPSSRRALLFAPPRELLRICLILRAREPPQSRALPRRPLRTPKPRSGSSRTSASLAMAPLAWSIRRQSRALARSAQRD